MKTLEEILSFTVKTGECLEWVRCFNTDGYPRMAWKGSSNGKVHRIVLELSTGEDLSGKVVRHKCDNPKCINPDHLVSGTAADNARDRDERGRTYKKITKEIVRRVRDLLGYKILSQKEIALLVGIDPRRVSDIKLHIYDDEAKVSKRRGGL